VKFTTATTGTGTITVGSAVTGYRTPAQASVPNADTFDYVLEDGAAWEIGTGTYTSSGTTVARTLIASSTGSLLSLSGNAVMYITAIASKLPYNYNENDTYLPSLTFGGGSVGMTYGSRSARWTRIGRFVFVQFVIVLTAKGSSTGPAQVSLPLTAAATYYHQNAIAFQNAAAALTNPTVEANAGTALANFNQISGTTTVNLTHANFTNTTALYFSLPYTV